MKQLDETGSNRGRTLCASGVISAGPRQNNKYKEDLEENWSILTFKTECLSQSHKKMNYATNEIYYFRGPNFFFLKSACLLNCKKNKKCCNRFHQHMETWSCTSHRKVKFALRLHIMKCLPQVFKKKWQKNTHNWLKLKGQVCHIWRFWEETVTSSVPLPGLPANYGGLHTQTCMSCSSLSSLVYLKMRGVTLITKHTVRLWLWR